MRHSSTPSRAAFPTAAIALSLVAAPAPIALAQDSTAASPTGSDALSPYAPALQRSAYTVDLVPLVSSWGNAFLIGPVLKAPAEIDPLFSTQMAGATSVSTEHAVATAFPPRAFARWAAPGVGLHPSNNSQPSPADAVTVTGFSRRFALGHTGVSAGATSIITAVIGQDASNPARLFVERTVALCSRPTASAPDTATLTLGGIDHAGTAAVRADAANAKAAEPVRQDNLLRIVSAARNPAVVPSLMWPEFPGASSTDPDAITYVGSNLDVAVTVPALLPAQTPASPIILSLDFAARFLANATPRNGALAPGLSALRGGPTYASINALGGIGAVASLARGSNASPVDSLNAFAVDAAGNPVVPSARSATIPSPLSAPAGYTINAHGNAEFRHYRNQTLFRGPYAHAAVGFDQPTSAPALSAAAADPDAGAGGAGEAMLVVRLTSPAPEWAVVAFAGTPIVDGPSPGATTLATIAAGNPVTFSSPAMDRLGNIYFVANTQPASGGAQTQALIKAVRTPTTPTGYTLERLLQSGQVFTGVNSTRPYTVTRLRLADSDSIDSGGFHAGALLQQQVPGAETAEPASSNAFGGVAVNAVITYDAGMPAQSQRYEATLFIAPAPPPTGCPTDMNSDGVVNTADLVAFLARFGLTVAPGSPGDFNADGAVNTIDLTRFLAGFGCGAR